VEDVVVAKDGREMVRFHGIFVGLPNVIKGQIIQNDYDEFIIKVVCTDQVSEVEFKTIIERMKSQLGDVRISIDRVKNIEGGVNGKFKAVISSILRNK
jgi:phenylacetate-CoA ligase